VRFRAVATKRNRKSARGCRIGDLAEVPWRKVPSSVRLTAEGSEDGTFIQKRKWMRWRMFNRLMDRANRVSRASAPRGRHCRTGDGATVAAVGSDPALAAVRAADRAKDDSGQG